MFEIRQTIYMTRNLISDIHIWTPPICSEYLSKDASILVICILFVAVTFLCFDKLKYKTVLIKFSKNIKIIMFQNGLNKTWTQQTRLI